jgi:ribosomal-protein-alanine N-acetyltransferase
LRIDIGNFEIRDWREEDAEDIARYADNRKIWQNLRDLFPHPYGLKDAKNFLALVFRQEPRTYFAIASAEEAMGAIGLELGSDVHRFTAEMGFWLGEPFWNRGIMTSAVIRFTEYAFERYNLHRIYAEPYVSNPASAKVLEKAGYTLEGTLRANVFKDGRILDQRLYARVSEKVHLREPPKFFA